ncbi:MAG: nitrate reductase molybdenum cofactor assembly chaperone [Alteromonadaceae bacterium]|nr:MAG: nitrate reductase molybdenum cofactor assembly chaperone [Alteromonadaceae bacterium]
MSTSNATLLSLISRLLDYPEATLFENREAVVAMVAESTVEPALRARLEIFLSEYLARNVMDCQAEYDGLFERGRSLGLWLFEHVHGESRDRGQAMVDLMAKYTEAGLEISQRELPDYIPLFLEFLATQGDENARSWLIDVEHILALLQVRLERRESGYSILLETLLSYAGSTISLDDVRKNVAGEKRDDNKKALDKEWEEEEVTFGADSLDKSCEKSKRRPSETQRKDLDVPLHWVGFDEGQASGTNATTTSSSRGAAK